MRFKWRRIFFQLIIGLFFLSGIFYLQIADMRIGNVDVFKVRRDLQRHDKFKNLPLSNVDKKITFEEKEPLKTKEKSRDSQDNEYLNFFNVFKLFNDKINGKFKQLNMLKELVTNNNINKGLSEKHSKHLDFILQELNENAPKISNSNNSSSASNALENIIEVIYEKFMQKTEAQQSLSTEKTKEKIIETTSYKNDQKPIEKQATEKKTVAENLPKFTHDFSDDELLAWHYKIKNYTTDIEIKEYYARDKRVIDKFSKPIDVKDIHNYIKDLFPQADRPEDDRILAQLHMKLINTTTKVILVKGGKGTQSELDNRGCNVGNCIITSDMKKYKKYDAVLYGRSVPKRKRTDMHKDEVWIFSNLESPVNSPGAGTFANFSETYRRDSVIVALYERFTTFPQYADLPKAPLKNFAHGKKKLAVWFVSHCNAPSRRDRYVQELQKYIPVDIFGRCYTKKCSRRNNACFDMLKTDYKFYLAFENSLCKDYISEKLYWNAYQNDILPVVMGAHPKEYKYAAPPRSFIHVDMFRSPKHLAEYLLFLDKHDDLYNSYFLWKGTGDYIDTKSICRICTMTHAAQYHRVWYENPNAWWNGPKVCRRKEVDGFAPTWKDNNVPIL